MNEDEAIITQLQWAVQALAAKPDEQPKLFPSFVCVACELLTDFDHWYRVAVSRELLVNTSGQIDALHAVDDAISSMEDTPCFDASQLERSDWHQLRQVAAACRLAFQWPDTLPPQGRSTYVQGG